MAIIAKYSLNWNANAQVWTNWTTTNVTWVDWKMNQCAYFPTKNTANTINLNNSYHLSAFTIDIIGNLRAFNIVATDYKVLVQRYIPNQDFYFWIKSDKVRLTCFTSWWVRTDHEFNITNSLNTFYLWTIAFSWTAIKILRNWIEIGTGPQSSIRQGWSNMTLWNSGSVDWVWEWLIDEAIIDNTYKSNAEAKNNFLYYNWFI